MPEIKQSESTHRWRRVSVEDVDIYVPWNAPVEASGRTFEFRELEGGDKAIVLRNIEEMAEDGDGNQNGGDRGDKGDGDVDDTTSGGSVHSM